MIAIADFVIRNGSATLPVMPGKPDGIPGSEMPRIFGRSRSNRSYGDSYRQMY